MTSSKIGRCGKIIKGILKVFASCFILWILMVATCDPNQFQYYRLASRDQQYYSDFAAACDGLIANAGDDYKTIRRDDLHSLPAILREFKPDYVRVSRDAVILSNGGTWSGNIIYWVADQNDPTRWNLAIRHGESSCRIVFSQKK